MKKIHLISKTHLDLGFTDLAEEVIKKYRNDFIPLAVKLADEMKETDTKFIWTAGSWLINDSLENASEENKAKLENAIKNGCISWHAMPFTTHTELLDGDTLEYGLSIAKKLDIKFNKKTVAAKMTDVPGHTISLVPYLAKAGIKLLHIGVNEASRLPDVPEAFLWRHESGAEIAVIYDKSYGGIYKNEFIDDILCFLHSEDNKGPSSKEYIENKVKQLKADYPDYEIAFSTLNDYAEAIWTVKDKLPVLTEEIGDTWIHGAASDPKKTADLNELKRLKTKWLDEGKLIKDTAEYEKFCDALIRVCEHTWGLDIKRHLGDFDNYLKKDFYKARKKDKVKIPPFCGGELKKDFRRLIKEGVYLKGSYSRMEKSWQEQRDYLSEAVNALPETLKTEAETAINGMHNFDYAGFEKVHFGSFALGKWEITFDPFGLKSLKESGVEAFNASIPMLSYHSYNSKGYLFWKEHYTRNYEATKAWSEPDFLRPLLKRFDKFYPAGRFPYMVNNLWKKENEFILEMGIESELSEKCGAPRDIKIKYVLVDDRIIIELIWKNKDASRLPEAMFFNFPMQGENIKYQKLGQPVNPFDIVNNGSRNLSAVESVSFTSNGKRFAVTPMHSPLVSLGRGKILEFDNLYGDIEKEGFSFNLHNNIWNTNFPLWYSSDGYFRFEITSDL